VRVAALYDIHGNLPALEAVLAEVERDSVDVIVVGGDVAGPFASETVERLRTLGDRAHWIRGNADRELSEPPNPRVGGPPPEVLEWTRARLSQEQLVFLAGLPLRETIEVDGLGPVLFCHATPRDDDEIVTRITSEERLRDVLAGVREHVVVCGHTHVQFERTVGEIKLVNAGSVGMPYEEQPGAYWALLGPDVHLRRTEVDSFDAISSSGYPEEWPRASPREATEFFERLARHRV
jgi:putative phosphoesterase